MRQNIAIVGRPNVGKSTLFNRIIGKRLAITEDEPGVTRDRLYHEAEWLGHYFNLIDTGGLELRSEDVFFSYIEEQVKLAIDLADVICFIVDGKAGIQPMDRDIATLLRKSGKKVIVAVNKIDAKEKEEWMYDFYELGLNPVLPISAEGGLGIGDLLDEMIESLDDRALEMPEDLIQVAVIGKPNVGKSSLVNLLLDENRMIVTNLAGTTRDAIDARVERKGKAYNFIDTAGLRRKRSVEAGVERYSVIRTLNAVDCSDICILMIDAQEGVTEQDTKIAGYAHEQKKGLIIIVNKWDLVKKETNTMRRFTEEIRDKLSFVHYAPIEFISVKEDKRIDKMFSLIDTVYNNYNLRIKTGVLNEVLADAVLRNPPPSDKGVELKIYYISQFATRPPSFMLHINSKRLFHFSYERYLENRLRENFGFVGVPLIFKKKGRKDD